MKKFALISLILSMVFAGCKNAEEVSSDTLNNIDSLILKEYIVGTWDSQITNCGQAWITLKKSGTFVIGEYDENGEIDESDSGTYVVDSNNGVETHAEIHNEENIYFNFDPLKLTLSLHSIIVVKNTR